MGVREKSSDEVIENSVQVGCIFATCIGMAQMDLVHEDAETVAYAGVCDECGKEYTLSYDKSKDREDDDEVRS
jgi:hypothetical protein